MSIDTQHKILFLDAYFEPEITAYSHLEKDLLDSLINNGYRITIICPQPTRGVDKDAHRNYQKVEYRYDNNVVIKRFKCRREGKNPLSRAVRYSYICKKIYRIARQEKNVSLIFCNSTPPTLGLTAIKVKKALNKKSKHKISFVYHLQDIFPDSLTNSGLSKKNSLLYRIGKQIEKRTYSGADKIITISNSFKNTLVTRGVDDNKVEVINNWIDLDKTIYINKKDNSLLRELHIDPNKFIVLYAGNIGETQGADIIIDVADMLVKYSNIFFVVFGSGSLYEDFLGKSRNKTNIIVRHLLPQDRVSEAYSLADVALITCKKGAGKSGLPSKTWSIMACNRPIIASFDVESDLSDVINESKSGVCVEPENAEALSEAIEMMYLNKSAAIYSRDYVKHFASKEKCVLRIVDIFKSIIL